jgi:hypothetical protein
MLVGITSFSANHSTMSLRASGFSRRPTRYDFKEYLFFAFQQGEAEEGRAKIAAYTKQVAFLGAAAGYKRIGGYFAYGSNAYNQSFLRSGSIAANQVNIVLFAGDVNAFIQLVQRFYTKPVAEADVYRDLGGYGVRFTTTLL